MREAARDRRTVAAMALSGALLVINWGTFIWAIARGHILDASLGYFIIPLLSVGLGMLVLGERLRRLQWIAIAAAVVGVAIQTWSAGGLPWISILVAASFGIYGLVRKLARVDSLVGSTLETALLVPVAAGLPRRSSRSRGGGELGHTRHPDRAVAAVDRRRHRGPAAAVQQRGAPAAAVDARLPAVPRADAASSCSPFAVYREPFARDQLVAFGFIWLGLAVFSFDLVRAAHGARRTARGALSRSGR